MATVPSAPDTSAWAKAKGWASVGHRVDVTWDKRTSCMRYNTLYYHIENINTLYQVLSTSIKSYTSTKPVTAVGRNGHPWGPPRWPPKSPGGGRIHPSGGSESPLMAEASAELFPSAEHPEMQKVCLKITVIVLSEYLEGGCGPFSCRERQDVSPIPGSTGWL